MISVCPWIAKTIGSISIGHRSDAKVSDWLIDVDPRVFAIWVITAYNIHADLYDVINLHHFLWYIAFPILVANVTLQTTLRISKCVRLVYWISAVNFVNVSNLVLTNWGWVTHICVSELTIIGSDNGLSPGRRQAIIWNNAGLLLIESLGTNFSEISTGIQTFSFKKMHLNMSSAKWRPFCLSLNVLMMRAMYSGLPL